MVFDLDGTLIDSKQDLVLSVNATLGAIGREELPADLVASYVGSGAPALIRRALGGAPDSEELRRALRYFLSHCEEHKLDHTRAYPGVREALVPHTKCTGSLAKEWSEWLGAEPSIAASLLGHLRSTRADRRRPAEQRKNPPHHERHAAAEVQREKEVERDGVVRAVRSIGTKVGDARRQLAREKALAHDHEYRCADRDQAKRA